MAGKRKDWISPGILSDRKRENLPFAIVISNLVHRKRAWSYPGIHFQHMSAFTVVCYRIPVWQGKQEAMSRLLRYTLNMRLVGLMIGKKRFK